jgi:hypothetical protein
VSNAIDDETDDAGDGGREMAVQETLVMAEEDKYNL